MRAARRQAVALRVLRRAAGLSQEHLALRAGVSQAGVARLELRQRRGRPDTWRRIAAALGVPVDVIRHVGHGGRR